ncbi:hypothetical protein Pd630_LPD07350 [Rhodococcus opacus PD630]|nr:hypothetical protein Pd630_LPD07350 [Rhodococcus opacus PD630]
MLLSGGRVDSVAGTDSEGDGPPPRSEHPASGTRATAEATVASAARVKVSVLILQT